MKYLLLALAVVTALTTDARGEVSLPSIIGDHMVLQQGTGASVWGWAAPGEKISVRIAGQNASAETGTTGKWKVQLKPIAAGGPYELTVAGVNTLTVKDVLAGEVWLFAGQSNMEWSLIESKNGPKALAEANYPEIRAFHVVGDLSRKPSDKVEGRWVDCSPQTMGGFSAVGYFFGRDLHQSLKIPVGLIGSYVGGTPAEAWTSWTSLQSHPVLNKEFIEPATAKLAKYDPTKGDSNPRGSGDFPAILFDHMIAPVVPYTIRGAVWYQGESNSGRAELYETQLTTLIQDWRAHWALGDFPFGIVQLPGYMAEQTQPVETSAWAQIREAQRRIAAGAPNAGLAVIIDAGETNDIHPREKQIIGHRLALWALATSYDRKIEYAGPTYQSMKVTGDAIQLTFAHAGAGLVARGEKLTGFAIAGEDQNFHAAEASIHGDKIVVRSSEVAKPVAVRYGWANNPACNLYNKDGLPASPFRTDD